MGEERHPLEVAAQKLNDAAEFLIKAAQPQFIIEVPDENCQGDTFKQEEPTAGPIKIEGVETRVVMPEPPEDYQIPLPYVESSKIEVVKLAEIRTERPSLRANHDKIKDKLRQSLLTFGQLNPIHVTEDGEVIKGRAVLECLKDIGATEVLIRRYDKLDQGRYESLQLTLTCLHQPIAELKLADALKIAVESTSKNNVLTRVPFNEKELEQLLLLTEMDWSAFLKEEGEDSGQIQMFDM